MGLKTEKDQKRFLTILADGKFHERVDEDTEGAKERVIERDNEEPETVYELTYPGIEAMITKMKFHEGDYGMNLLIDMEDEDDNQFCVSLKCSTNYGERFMEVLPNLDLNKEVDLTPFSFKPRGSDQKVRGLTIKQDNEKVFSAFSKKEEDGDWEVLIDGYPMPDASKKYTKEKWTLFFGQRRDWVMDYLIENDFILSADAPDEEDVEDEDDEEVEEAPKKKVAKKVAKKGTIEEEAF